MKRILNFCLVGLLASHLMANDKYTHMLKKGQSSSMMSRSGTNGTSKVTVDCDAFEPTNTNPASHNTPWNFHFYPLDGIAAHFPSGVPSGLGTWTTKELEILGKAVNFWNNSKARVKLNYHEADRTSWKTDYGWAQDAGYPYTLLKVTSELKTKDGKTTIFPQPGGSGNVLGQAWNFATNKTSFNGPSYMSQIVEGSFSGGSKTWATYKNCDALGGGSSVVYPECVIKSCEDMDPVFTNLPAQNCSPAPRTITGPFRLNGTCADPNTASDYWSCFELTCHDMLVQGVSGINDIPDYTKCLSKDIQCLRGENPGEVTASTVVFNFIPSDNVNWAYNPDDLFEADEKYQASTSTYDMTNYSKASFTKVAIHEIGHVLGLDHYNRLYDVDEGKVHSGFTGISMKDYILNSFQKHSVSSGSFPLFTSGLSYANSSNLSNPALRYVTTSGTVYKLERSSGATPTWSWQADGTDAETVRGRAFGRMRSVMSTQEVGTNPVDIHASSFLHYGDLCMLTTTGCGDDQIFNKYFDYRLIYDLYNANPETSHDRGGEK